MGSIEVFLVAAMLFVVVLQRAFLHSFCIILVLEEAAVHWAPTWVERRKGLNMKKGRDTVDVDFLHTYITLRSEATRLTTYLQSHLMISQLPLYMVYLGALSYCIVSRCTCHSALISQTC